MRTIPRPLLFHVDSALVTFSCAPFVQNQPGSERLPGLFLCYQQNKTAAQLPTQRMMPAHLRHFYENYWFTNETHHAEARANLESLGAKPEVRSLLAQLNKDTLLPSLFTAEVDEYIGLRASGGFRGSFKPLEDLQPGSPAVRVEQKRSRALAWIEKNFGSLDKFVEETRELARSGVKTERHALIESFFAKKLWEISPEPRRDEGEDYYRELAERVRLFKEGEGARQPAAADALAPPPPHAPDEIDAFLQRVDEELRGNREFPVDDKFRVYQYLDQKFTRAKRDFAVAEISLSTPISAQMSPEAAGRLLRSEAHDSRLPEAAQGPLASLTYQLDAAGAGCRFALTRHAREFSFQLDGGQMGLLREYLRFLEPLIRSWHNGTAYLQPSSDPEEQNYREAQMLDLLGRFKSRAKIMEERARLAQLQGRKGRSVIHRGPAPEERRQRAAAEREKAEVSREMAELQSKVIVSPPESMIKPRLKSR